MADQTPEKSSIFTRIQNSTGYILLLTLFSAITYIQDIFQDVLVISSSVSSPANYSVISSMKIEEKKLGYFMGCVFLLSIVVVGWDAMTRGSQLILVREHKWLHILMVSACLLNLGPVFFIILGIFMRTNRVKARIQMSQI